MYPEEDWEYIRRREVVRPVVLPERRPSRGRLDSNYYVRRQVYYPESGGFLVPEASVPLQRSRSTGHRPDIVINNINQDEFRGRPSSAVYDDLDSERGHSPLSVSRNHSPYRPHSMSLSSRELALYRHSPVPETQRLREENDKLRERERREEEEKYLREK